MGSRGTILDLDCFLSYSDTKLVMQASELVGKDDMLAFGKHGGFFSICAASKLISSQKCGDNSVINVGNYKI
jgi:hypothetical protein